MCWSSPVSRSPGRGAVDTWYAPETGGSRQKPASTFRPPAATGRQCRCARLRRPDRAAGPVDRRLPGAVPTPPDGVAPGWAGLVLVTGEAGIGKTALLNRFAGEVAAEGGTVVWGTCWDGDQAPAWWPWTQALRALLDRRPGLATAARPELAAIVPELAADPPAIGADAAARIRVFDAVGQILRRATADAPVVVILDDLHWADESTVDLLRFVAQQPQAGALLLVGAYRPDEPPPGIVAGLADLATVAELVPLQGLSAGEVADLVRVVTGAAAREHWAPMVHERSGGHPFYARELCQLLAAGGGAADVPAAVREVIGRRLARLSPGCATLLDAAAVAGATLLPDVLAEVTGADTTRVAALTDEATAAGILARRTRRRRRVRPRSLPGDHLRRPRPGAPAGPAPSGRHRPAAPARAGQPGVRGRARLPLHRRHPGCRRRTRGRVGAGRRRHRCHAFRVRRGRGPPHPPAIRGRRRRPAAARPGSGRPAHRRSGPAAACRRRRRGAGPARHRVVPSHRHRPGRPPRRGRPGPGPRRRPLRDAAGRTSSPCSTPRARR